MNESDEDTRLYAVCGKTSVTLNQLITTLHWDAKPDDPSLYEPIVALHSRED